MKRFFIFIVLLGAALVFGGKFYYQQQITKNMDEFAQTLQAMGEFSYNNVNVTASGEAQINKIRFKPHGYSDEVLIERLALRTGNLMGLYHLDKELQQQMVPENLGISILGLRILTGGQLYRASESTTGSGSFEAAGCGDRHRFSGHDLMDMGIDELVMDMDLDYQLINQGQTIKLSAHTFTRNIARVNFTADLQLGASSRATRAIAAAFTKAEWNSIDIHYQDLGYVTEVIKFCAAETQLKRADYLTHHLAAWKNHWHRLGLVAGPNLVSAYEAFLQYPDEVDIKLQPSGRMAIKNVFDTPASILIYQVQGKLQVNRKPAGNLDFVAQTDEEQQVFSLREAEAATPAKVPGATAAVKPTATAVPSPVTPDNLDQHLGKMVRITLSNGKDYRGRIRTVEGGRLQLQRYESGGHMLMPVVVQDITQVHVIE